jgi:uncharacterized protein YjbI with pentapeptide repeats
MVYFADEPGGSDLPAAGTAGLVVYSARSRVKANHLAVFSLASWGDDDALDYLIAVHREAADSVMKRLRACRDRSLLDRTPELWAVVLDQMAADESIAQVRAALERHLTIRAWDESAWETACDACLAFLLNASEEPVPQTLKMQNCPERILRAIRHASVQLLLASQKVAADLRAGQPCSYFSRPLAVNMVNLTAVLISNDVQAQNHLHRLLADYPWKQANVASILHATDPGWKPEPGRVSALGGAFLAGAHWPEVNLEGATVAGADLRRANLERAVLDRVNAFKGNLSHANLRGASLNGLRASEANMAHADLSGAHGTDVQLHYADLKRANLESVVLRSSDLHGANLTGANFRQADLRHSDIATTHLRDADFSGANLEEARLKGVKLCEARFYGASFFGAMLWGANLEDMELPGENFQNANLNHALLTGAAMPGANLSKAFLCNAGLADINWEGANLSFADLRGATFHLGSTRSGKVDSFIASEGTRTGFYTDDFEEQFFKAPEEIRKANLRGADLRGALIEDVDFYLVDVRGALYDEDQEKHLRRCRAILEERC